MATNDNASEMETAAEWSQGDGDPVAEPQSVAPPGESIVLRVALLGSSACGKAALVSRLGGGDFLSEYQETLGVDVSVVQAVGAEGEGAGLQLWVCSGAPRYLPIVQQALEGADVVLLVYDVTSVESLQRGVFWRNEAVRLCPAAKMMLVGNKIDQDTQVRVSEADGAKQAESWGVAHVLVSCKSGKGVQILMNKLVECAAQ